MIGTELLDDPAADPVAVNRELRDIARLNALFGGTRAVVRELEPFFKRRGRESGNGKRETWTLLDVGTGLGDIPRAAARAAWRYGITLRLVGIERNRTAARLARVLADLRRSRVAMAGVWAACFGLAMGRVTRHDAVVSLRRGYTRVEFSAMLRAAGVRAVAHCRPGFRIVASWSPENSVQ